MNFKYLWYLFLIWTVFSSCSSRNQDLTKELNISVPLKSELPDSIRLHLKALKDVQLQTEYLLRLCQQSYLKWPVGALEFAGIAEALVKDTRFKKEYAKALYWKSFIQNQEDPESIKLRSALANLRVCIEILEREKDLLWLARALNLRALIHYNLYEEEKGRGFNQKARQVLKDAYLDETKYPKIWGDIFRTAGNIELYTTENTDTVLAYFDKSYRCYAKLKDSIHLARLLVNYAIVHDKREELEQSDSLFQEAIVLYDQFNNVDHLSKAYLDYATFHATRFKNKKELRWLASSNQLLEIALNLRPHNMAEIFFQYGSNFHNMAIYDADNEKMFYDSASYYYQKVLSLGVEEKNTHYIEKVSFELAKICPEIKASNCTELLTQASKAYQYISDSTASELERASIIMEQHQIDKARKKFRQTIFWACLFIVGIIVFSFITIQSSRIKLLLTRLEALRSQMNPHFISNSLNAIDSLVNQNRNEEASEYIIDFSRLCRLILNNSKKDLISLKVELETLGYYLSLEQLRMRKKLEYVFKIDENLDLKKVFVPPMVFQPFIENAIIHGIQNKQAPGNLLVTIRQKNSQLLECLIEDDGVGRDKARALRKKSVIERPSLGIHITQERIDGIRKIRGTSIKIVDLRDELGASCGTRVTILLPIIYKND